MMKKFTFIMGILLCLTACGSSEVVREARKTVNGDWMLESITYPGQQSGISVNLLNDASYSCFTESTWHFVSNNNTGSYVLQGQNCGTETRFFNWSIEEGSGEEEYYDFMLKPTDSRSRSTSGNQGFRIRLLNLTQDRMVWDQTINFEGEPFTIKMNFTKN